MAPNPPQHNSAKNFDSPVEVAGDDLSRTISELQQAGYFVNRMQAGIDGSNSKYKLWFFKLASSVKKLEKSCGEIQMTMRELTDSETKKIR